MWGEAASVLLCFGRRLQKGASCAGISLIKPIETHLKNADQYTVCITCVPGHCLKSMLSQSRDMKAGGRSKGQTDRQTDRWNERQVDGQIGVRGLRRQQSNSTPQIYLSYSIVNLLSTPDLMQQTSSNLFANSLDSCREASRCSYFGENNKTKQ